MNAFNIIDGMIDDIMQTRLDIYFFIMGSAWLSSGCGIPTTTALDEACELNIRLRDLTHPVKIIFNSALVD